MNAPLTLAAVLVGGCLAIVGSLIVLNLRSIKSCLRSFTRRIDKQDGQIEKAKDSVNSLGKDLRECKIDCERSFVNAELFLRETGFTRRSLQTLTTSVNRIEGKLTVVEQMPKIVGDISREIVKEMKNGGSNG